ncbi:Lipase 3 [Halotydeus destructor]|nr:Lipase 3 [Halotydeus destructor]
MRGNLKRYSQLHPPEYMLENITNKYIALFRAKNDWLADPQDVEFLKARLQEPLIQDYEVPFERWNHIDFIWGMQAGQFVNEPVLALLKKYA